MPTKKKKEETKENAIYIAKNPIRYEGRRFKIGEVINMPTRDIQALDKADYKVK